MPVYRCESDEYPTMPRGKKIILSGNVATNEDGDSLKIDVKYLLDHPEHFVLEGEPVVPAVEQPTVDLPPASSGTPMPKVRPPLAENDAGYAVVRRIGKIHKTLDDARKSAGKKGSGKSYIVKVIGTVIHEVTFNPTEGVPA